MVRPPLLATALAAVCVASAFAAPLEPKKASEIVTLRTNGNTTGCQSDVHLAFDTQAVGDGAFSVPAGSVLLVTDVSSTAENSNFPLELWLGNSTLSAGGAVAYIPDFEPHTSSLHFTTPLVVRSDEVLCIGPLIEGATLSARLTGFIAKDK
jgi:hypothetical protein